MGDWTDPLYRLRYGVPSNEKYRMAVTGEIPGARPIESEGDVDREERRASTYLFNKQHPTIGPVVQPTVDFLRKYLFRDNPDVLQAAGEGLDYALAERQRPGGFGQVGRLPVAAAGFGRLR